MRLAESFRPFDRLAYRNNVLDGLMEIALGLFLAPMALAAGTSLFYFPMLAVLFILIPALRLMQRRFTAPRIGYVQPIADIVLPGILVYTAVGIAAAVLIVYLAARPNLALMPHLLIRWSSALAGLLIAGGFWYAGSRSGLKRFYAFAILSPIAGSAIAALNLGDAVPFLAASRMSALRLFLLLLSAILLPSGVVNFALFLHRYPVQLPEAHHVQS